MKIFRDVSAFPEDIHTVVTVGKFDGLHRGHTAITERLRELATEHNLKSTVITFDRNPLELLSPTAAPISLSTLDQKVELLAQTGIDCTVVLYFDEQLKEQSPEAFIQMLANDLNAKIILAGQDFHFGAQGRGDLETLQKLAEEYGYQVVVIDDALEGDAEGERRISSTWIRELLADGKVEQANDLLGRPHTVSGKIVHGLKRGRELGFPTANLETHPQGFVPADGVYSGYLIHQGQRYRAAISVGTNPTFDDVPVRQVEAFLPGIEIDLYGEQVTIEFHHWIRGMVAFNGIDSLIERMHQDVDEILVKLSEE